MLGGDAGVVTHGVLAWGLVALVLVVIADTRLYPLALGLLLIAIVYVFVEGPGTGILQWFSGFVAGTPQAGPPAGSK